MNVDDAMEAAAEFRAEHEIEQEPGMLFSEIVSITLADEVERLRAELAAAKAASVVPVRVLGIYETEYPSDCYIEFRTGDDCGKFRDWIRDRMKERGEG